jgi:hypothetical protein
VPSLSEDAPAKAPLNGAVDDLIASKVAGGKRKREEDPEAAAKAAAKKEELANALASIDWRAELAANALKKRTVPQLKAYCSANGLKPKPKKVSLSLSLSLRVSVSLSVIHISASQRLVLGASARSLECVDSTGLNSSHVQHMHGLKLLSLWLLACTWSCSLAGRPFGAGHKAPAGRRLSPAPVSSRGRGVSQKRQRYRKEQGG